MANEKFELRGINHLALVCKDMKRTVDFYEGVLGMRFDYYIGQMKQIPVI